MKKTLMRVAVVVVWTAMTAAWADPAPRVLYDDVRNTHHPVTVTTTNGATGTASRNNNRSGLGDGTNPGSGSGNNNSGNTGTNNPGGARR